MYDKLRMAKGYRCSCSASIRDGGVINIVGSVYAEAAISEGSPQQTLVRTIVSVGVGLNPGVSCIHKSRVARLQRKRVDEKMEPDDVSFGSPTSARFSVSPKCVIKTQHKLTRDLFAPFARTHTPVRERRTRCGAYSPRLRRCCGPRSGKRRRSSVEDW